MNEALQAAWQCSVDNLACELSHRQFDAWIQPLRWFGCVGEDVAQVVAPNTCVRSWVMRRFASRIEGHLARAMGGRTVRLDIVVPTATAAPPLFALRPDGRRQVARPGLPLTDRPVARRSPQKTPQRAASPVNGEAGGELSNLLGAASLQERYRLDKFVAGPCNASACIAAEAVIRSERREEHNPMLIIGDTALGKTHLMQAIGHEMLARRPDTRLLYTSAERFTRHYLQALRSPNKKHETDRFQSLLGSVDVLLVDDVHGLATAKATQEEFFSTFNILLERHVQVILTSDRHPHVIKGLQKRLKSRLTWGLPVTIEAPDKEMRLSILRQKAQDQDATLPDEVAEMLAERITSNVRDLEGALNRTLTEARSNGGKISVGLAARILTDLLTQQRPHTTLAEIQRTVAAYYDISPTVMLSKSRQRTVVRPRQMAMSLARNLTRHSLPEIGKAFGGRDHTTVLHACRRIADLGKADADVRNDRQTLMHRLKASPE